MGQGASGRRRGGNCNSFASKRRGAGRGRAARVSWGDMLGATQPLLLRLDSWLDA